MELDNENYNSKDAYVRSLEDRYSAALDGGELVDAISFCDQIVEHCEKPENEDLPLADAYRDLSERMHSWEFVECDC